MYKRLLPIALTLALFGTSHLACKAQDGMDQLFGGTTDMQGDGAWCTDLADGKQALSQGDLGTAEVDLRHALSEAQEEGHANDLVDAEILKWLGLVMVKKNDLPGAQDTYQQEYNIRSAQSCSPKTLAYCLVRLGKVQYANGDFSDAQTNMQQAIALLQQLPESFQRNNAITLAGNVISQSIKKQGD